MGENIKQIRFSFLIPLNSTTRDGLLLQNVQSALDGPNTTSVFSQLLLSVQVNTAEPILNLFSHDAPLQPQETVPFYHY